MTNVEFRLWVKGYLELSEEPKINTKQLRILNSHANLAHDTDGKLDVDIQQFLDECQTALQTDNLENKDSLDGSQDISILLAKLPSLNAMLLTL